MEYIELHEPDPRPGNEAIALADCLPICLLIQVEKGGKLVLEPRILLIPLNLYRAGSQEVVSSILTSSTNKPS
jgi:hypothetical protein